MPIHRANLTEYTLLVPSSVLVIHPCSVLPSSVWFSLRCGPRQDWDEVLYHRRWLIPWEENRACFYMLQCGANLRRPSSHYILSAGTACIHRTLHFNPFFLVCLRAFV